MSDPTSPSALARAVLAQVLANTCRHGTPRTACRDCSTPAQPAPPSAESAPTEESA